VLVVDAQRILVSADTFTTEIITNIISAKKNLKVLILSLLLEI
jgi:hypothetical protein